MYLGKKPNRNVGERKNKEVSGAKRHTREQVIL